MVYSGMKTDKLSTVRTIFVSWVGKGTPYLDVHATEEAAQTFVEGWADVRECPHVEWRGGDFVSVDRPEGEVIRTLGGYCTRVI